MGYGNAAGYLFSRGIMEEHAQSNTQQEELDNVSPNVDPISGAFPKETSDPFAGMTDEEKERESERLFVLFDRLNKTGIIKTIHKND